MTGTIAAPVRPGTRSAARPVARAPRSNRRRGEAGWLFWLTAVAAAAVTLTRNHWIFTTPVHESGSAALNSILAQNAQHGLLLTGPVSATGAPQPGPAYPYLLALGQSLFHDWLPLTASPFGGQFLAVTILQSVLLGLTAGVLLRLTGWWPAALGGAGVLLWFSASHTLIGELAPSTLAATAFALFLAGAAGLTAGRTRELPAFVLGAALLAHSDVAFLLVGVVTALLATLGWRLVHHGPDRPVGRSGRAPRWTAGGILAAFLLPVAAEVTLHFPGPWPRYPGLGWRGPGHRLQPSLTFFGHFWRAAYPVTVTILATSVAIALLLLEQNRDRARIFLSGYAILVLQSALFLGYIQHGLGSLTPASYPAGRFYEAVPMFLLVLPAVHLPLLVRELVPANRVIPAIVAAVVLAGVGATAGGEQPRDNADTVGAARLVAVLRADHHRSGRPVVLRLTGDQWPFAAAVVVEARRRGLPVCLADPAWRDRFSAELICASTGGHYPVALISRAGLGHRSTSHPLWSDRQHVALPGPLPKRPRPAKPPQPAKPSKLGTGRR